MLTALREQKQIQFSSRSILMYESSLLPVWRVVDFDALGVGQRVLGLKNLIIPDILPAASVIYLPLVKSPIG